MATLGSLPAAPVERQSSLEHHIAFPDKGLELPGRGGLARMILWALRPAGKFSKEDATRRAGPGAASKVTPVLICPREAPAAAPTAQASTQAPALSAPPAPTVEAPPPQTQSRVEEIEEVSPSELPAAARTEEAKVATLAPSMDGVTTEHSTGVEVEADTNHTVSGARHSSLMHGALSGITSLPRAVGASSWRVCEACERMNSLHLGFMCPIPSTAMGLAALELPAHGPALHACSTRQGEHGAHHQGLPAKLLETVENAPRQVYAAAAGAWKNVQFTRTGFMYMIPFPSANTL